MSTAPPVANRQSCATATSILVLNGETAMSGSTSVSGSQLPWVPQSVGRSGPRARRTAARAGLPARARRCRGLPALRSRRKPSVRGADSARFLPVVRGPSAADASRTVDAVYRLAAPDGTGARGTLDRHRNRVNGATRSVHVLLPSPDRV